MQLNKKPTVAVARNFTIYVVSTIFKLVSPTLIYAGINLQGVGIKLSDLSTSEACNFMCI